eukprot:CAMPEP_0116557988 /NCGR_PEP_ID=MMETSP0397-20121206/9558_1 /TAXON_ID=216820 /ORGANISM="Cyclophora tenuis, Strain ECT3854" /LENGTH=181 /DNA_ID=CAMNT_0004083531 /DNA_START=175 /DNA_END=723 /DNA_ORIENTATION=+
MGFGTTNYGGLLSDELRQVDIQIIDHNDCNDANSYNGEVYDSTMICAGSTTGGQDSCGGDSGGPLIVREDTGSAHNGAVVVVLVGISSFGTGCGLVDYPGVYTRVSAYAEWISLGICDFARTKPLSCFATPTITTASSRKSPAALDSWFSLRTTTTTTTTSAIGVGVGVVQDETLRGEDNE